MNPREQFLVERLVERLVTQPPQQVDADAQREVELLMRRRPDAPYLLLQRALQLEEALKLAYEEIEQMRRRGAPAAPDASAFGRSAGEGAAGRPAAGAANASASTATGPAAVAASMGAAGAPAAPGDRAAAGSGSFGGPRGSAVGGGLFGGAPGGMAQPGAAQPAGGGFLRNAGAVAAGVLGGSLLFQGIENLLHPHGSGLLGGNAPATVSETTNNFFEAPPDQPEPGAGAGFEPLPDPSQGDAYAAEDAPQGDSYAPDDYGVDDGQIASDDSGVWDDSGGSDDWA